MASATDVMYGPNMTYRFATIVLALAACGGSTKTTEMPPPSPPLPATDTPPAPTTETPPAPTQGAPAVVSQLGQPCSDACVAPAKCEHFSGIAGPRGPQLSSCELRCADDGAACPDGTACITIADGPGRVCRPTAPAN
jgi:hypothetical protein